MISSIEKRALAIGEYIATTNSTVRVTAKVFSYSKSTVHNDIKKRLKKINHPLYIKVQKIMLINAQEKHFRGGLATKKKYQAERLAKK